MVRCAPCRLPLRRRAQTAALVLAMWLLPLVVILLLALAFFPPFVRWYSREALLAYLAWWLLVDRKRPLRGGRPIRAVQRWPLWNLIAAYFPAQLHTPYAPNGYDPQKPHIFGLHPHGVISLGAISNLAFDASESRQRLRVDYRIVTVSANFNVPLWRDMLMAMGFASASRESVHHLLATGKSAMIVLGGAAEALDARPGSTELTLLRRKGFVRLALKHGARLVPVYNFGENELYTQVNNPRGSALRKLQELAIRWLGFTIPLVLGRGIFMYDAGTGVLPRRVPLHTVMGECVLCTDQRCSPSRCGCFAPACDGGVA